jgi:phosphoribosylformylglycinamidine synthase
MSGSFMELDVPPTLVSFAVSAVDANDVISSELKNEDSVLIYMNADRDENQIIDFTQYHTNMKRVRELALEGKILSANTVGRGGVFISLAKMAVGNGIGAELENITAKELRNPDYGALILELSQNDNIESLLKGAQYKIIGKTASHRKLTVRPSEEGENPGAPMEFPLDEIVKKWTEPLEGIFPTKRKAVAAIAAEHPMTISYSIRSSRTPAVKIVRPRVFIPAFPGTNCEMDSKRAFEKAGAVADIQILRNLNQTELIDSIDEMVRMIRSSQIIMIPGGFSGGDEPDGSAKFITAVFRNPAVRDAVEDLLANRDGLMLGICNGFQALIKLGLVPFGTITEPDKANPTLTYNRIGRHASCLVRTRIASAKSPWLANTDVGDIHTVPVSHGEGRFIASEEIIKRLVENGQIATQYVDLSGKPNMETAYNPNESILAIEGITSPDGRVFGKMAHSERIGKNLYRNVPGNTDQKIFEAGFAYFR